MGVRNQGWERWGMEGWDIWTIYRRQAICIFIMQTVELRYSDEESLDQNATESTGPQIHFCFSYRRLWFQSQCENAEIKLIGMVSILDEPINHEIEYLGEPAAPIFSFLLSFCCMGNLHTSRKYFPSRGNIKYLLSFVSSFQFDYLRTLLMLDWGGVYSPCLEASSPWTCIKCAEVMLLPVLGILQEEKTSPTESVN